MAIIFKPSGNRMPKKFRIINPRTGKTVRTIRTRRRKSTPSKSYIKRIVNSLEETKQITDTITDGTLFNGAIQSSTECYNALPAVLRGDTSYQRDGDKIQPMYLTLRFILQVTGGMPIHAHLFVLEDKINRDGNVSRDYNFLNLNGTDTNFDGSWINAGYPVNVEDFKLIKRKKIKLAYDQQPGGTGTGTTENGLIFKEIKIKVPIRKLHKYLDYWGSPSTSPQPKNANLFWAIGYVNADGSIDSVSTRLKVTCISTLYYKDA